MQIVNKPYGKFVVELSYEVKIKLPFWQTKTKTETRLLDEWGRYALPWWEAKQFDTVTEARLFAQWYINGSEDSSNYVLL